MCEFFFFFSVVEWRAEESKPYITLRMSFITFDWNVVSLEFRLIKSRGGGGGWISLPTFSTL